jgi:hypothetical protein
MDPDPTFYFGALSPYSWFAAERLAAMRAPIRWRPLFVGGLFRARNRTAWGLTSDRTRKIEDCERRAREPPPLLRRHVDVLTPTFQQPPENGGTDVAESGAFSARQHGCHEPPLLGQAEVAHRIHGSMHTMEPLPPHPPLDLRPAQSERTELSA